VDCSTMSEEVSRASKEVQQLSEITGPVLDRLQHRMEAVALGEEDNSGAFCGRCFNRLDDTRRTSNLPLQCPVCRTSTQDSAPVEHVPGEVLAIYMAKRTREGLIVNLFAFAGIFLSLLLSALLWFLLPSNLWRIASFAMLALGSYYLARLVGYQVGVPIGAESGRRLRDRRWREFEQLRQDGA
jgi:hypothetical protein